VVVCDVVRVVCRVVMFLLCVCVCDLFLFYRVSQGVVKGAFELLTMRRVVQLVERLNSQAKAPMLPLKYEPPLYITIYTCRVSQRVVRGAVVMGCTGQTAFPN